MLTKLKTYLRITLFMLFFPVALLKSQSLDNNISEKLQFTLDSIRTAQNIQGISASMYYPGYGLWQGVSGFSHPGTALNTKMIFGIASNTKLFTAIVILKLTESGHVSLTDTIGQWITTNPNVNPSITVRQLLNHTSGLKSYHEIPGYPDSILSNPKRIFDPLELVGWIGPPEFPPGTSWNYSNSNYLIAGIIAEQVSGLSFHTYLNDSILIPIGLDSSSIIPMPVNGFIAHPWTNGFNNIGIPRNSLNSSAWTAGAMYSNSGDMVKWYDKILRTGFLSQTSFNELTNFLPGSNYGLGIRKIDQFGRTLYGHTGSIWGMYNSIMYFDVQNEFTICVLINDNKPALSVGNALLKTVIDNINKITNISIEEDVTGLSIYPNPVFDLVSIRTQNLIIKSSKLFDLSGREVLNITGNTFSVRGLSQGIYFLKLETAAGNKIVKRLMKVGM